LISYGYSSIKKLTGEDVIINNLFQRLVVTKLMTGPN